MTHLQPQWGAIGVIVPVLVVVISGGIFRGLRAPDLVYARYAANRQTARAAIEGDAIIPSLTALMGDVSDRALEDGVDVATSLQRVRYRPALGRLSAYYGHLTLLDALPREIERWIRLQAASLAIFVVGALVVLAPAAIDGLMLAAPATTIGYVFASTGLILTFALAVLEANARNRLVSILEVYDNFQLDL